MRPLHVVIFTDGRFVRIVKLTEERNLIGRREGCHIWLLDNSVSREHAVITPTETGWAIEDLNSRNGTYIDWVRIVQPESLWLHREVQIGCFVLKIKFEMESAIRESNMLDDAIWTFESIPEHAMPGPLTLTPSQDRVYSLLLQGMTKKDIALNLGLSVSAVGRHLKEIYRALSLPTRAELAARTASHLRSES